MSVNLNNPASACSSSKSDENVTGGPTTSTSRNSSSSNNATTHPLRIDVYALLDEKFQKTVLIHRKHTGPLTHPFLSPATPQAKFKWQLKALEKTGAELAPLLDTAVGGHEATNSWIQEGTYAELRSDRRWGTIIGELLNPSRRNVQREGGDGLTGFFTIGRKRRHDEVD